MKAWRKTQIGIDRERRSARIEKSALNYQLSDFRATRLCKAIALILIFAFIWSDITRAQGGTPIWHQARPKIALNGKARLNGIKVPYDAGTAQDAFSNGGDEIVINIQDAHASLSAQHSIVKILQNLATNYDLDHLMRKGKMSAGEFFSVISEKPVQLYGVEDNDLYKANIESLNAVMEGKLESLRNIDAVLKALKALEPKVYSGDLTQLNKNSILHHDSKLAFTAHWDFISKLAGRNNIEIVIFENLSKLLKSIELEKGIDFEKANEERKLLIDELSRILPKREIEKLVLESLSFKMGKISQAEFHRYLVRLAEDIKVLPEPYSNLINFTRYITIYEDIDLLALFREVEEFEDYIREKIYRNDEERELYNFTRAVRTIKKLFEISLSNTDYDFVTSKKRYFDRAPLSEFIKKSYLKHKLPIEQAYDLGVIFDNMQEAVKFYNIAQRRNNAMIANTIHAMKKNNEQVAALITGGFHSKGLSALMKEKGLSYLVIMPKFEEGTQRPYIAVLTNKRQPYEELLETGEYILAVRALFEKSASPEEFNELVFYASTRELCKHDLSENEHYAILKKWCYLIRGEEKAMKERGEYNRPFSMYEMVTKLLGFRLDKNDTDGNIVGRDEKEGIRIYEIADGEAAIGWKSKGEFIHTLALERNDKGEWDFDLASKKQRGAFMRHIRKEKPAAEKEKRTAHVITAGFNEATLLELFNPDNFGREAERQAIISRIKDAMLTEEGRLRPGVSIEEVREKVKKVLKVKGYRLPAEEQMNRKLAEGMNEFTKIVESAIIEEINALKTPIVPRGTAKPLVEGGYLYIDRIRGMLREAEIQLGRDDIEDILITGTAPYLTDVDGRISIGVIKDLDILLVISSNAKRKDILAELNPVLKSLSGKYGIALDIREPGLKAVEMSKKYRLPEPPALPTLVFGDGSDIRLDVTVESVRHIRREDISRFLAAKALSDLTDWLDARNVVKDGAGEEEHAETFIKQYLRLEYLLGHPNHKQFERARKAFLTETGNHIKQKRKIEKRWIPVLIAKMASQDHNALVLTVEERLKPQKKPAHGFRIETKPPRPAEKAAARDSRKAQIVIAGQSRDTLAGKANVRKTKIADAMQVLPTDKKDAGLSSDEETAVKPEISRDDKPSGPGGKFMTWLFTCLIFLLSAITNVTQARTEPSTRPAGVVSAISAEARPASIAEKARKAIKLSAEAIRILYPGISEEEFTSRLAANFLTKWHETAGLKAMRQTGGGPARGPGIEIGRWIMKKGKRVYRPSTAEDIIRYIKSKGAGERARLIRALDIALNGKWNEIALLHGARLGRKLGAELMQNPEFAELMLNIRYMYGIRRGLPKFTSKFDKKGNIIPESILPQAKYWQANFQRGRKTAIVKKRVKSFLTSAERLPKSVYDIILAERAKPEAKKTATAPAPAKRKSPTAIKAREKTKKPAKITKARKTVKAKKAKAKPAAIKSKIVSRKHPRAMKLIFEIAAIIALVIVAYKSLAIKKDLNNFVRQGKPGDVFEADLGKDLLRSPDIMNTLLTSENEISIAKIPDTFRYLFEVGAEDAGTQASEEPYVFEGRVHPPRFSRKRTLFGEKKTPIPGNYFMPSFVELNLSNLNTYYIISGRGLTWYSADSEYLKKPGHRDSYERFLHMAHVTPLKKIKEDPRLAALKIKIDFDEIKPESNKWGMGIISAALLSQAIYDSVTGAPFARDGIQQAGFLGNFGWVAGIILAAGAVMYLIINRFKIASRIENLRKKPDMSETEEKPEERITEKELREQETPESEAQKQAKPDKDKSSTAIMHESKIYKYKEPFVINVIKIDREDIVGQEGLENSKYIELIEGIIKPILDVRPDIKEINLKLIKETGNAFKVHRDENKIGINVLLLDALLMAMEKGKYSPGIFYGEVGKWFIDHDIRYLLLHETISDRAPPIGELANTLIDIKDFLLMSEKGQNALLWILDKNNK